jgi:hypothetical protein
MSSPIVNLSSHTLSETELKVLSLGLKFVPTPNSKPHVDLAVESFIQSMNTQYMFRNRQTPKPAFYNKNSHWSPEPASHPEIIEFQSALNAYLIESQAAVDEYGQETPISNHHDNLTEGEKQALLSLKKNKNIVIKPSDKGNGIVIMDRTYYVDRTLEHLSDETLYQPMPHDQTPTVAQEIETYLAFLRATNQIDPTLSRQLSPPQPLRTPVIYTLPKTNKPAIPLRPIISACSGPTSNLSDYLTHILNPIVQSLPSYLGSTKELLQIIDSLPPQNPKTWLCTADVSSMYLKIPIEEGISAVERAIGEFSHLLPKRTPPPPVIRQFLNFILKNNYFEFMNKYYHQIDGTSMGTKCAPPYSGIFMGFFEQDLIAPFAHNIKLWRRYIDDILFLFKGSLTRLQKFLEHMNSFHPAIKFTWEHSKNSVNFLDVKIYRDNMDKLQTTLYKKASKPSLFLHFDSFHPPHIFRNIVYGQCIRLCTIISERKKLLVELTNLKKAFISRGYPKKMIHLQISKALSIPRPSLLKNRPKPPQKQKLIFRLKHSLKAKYHRQNIANLWKSHIKCDSLKKLWPNPPAFCTSNHRNLKDLLVHTKLK